MKHKLEIELEGTGRGLAKFSYYNLHERSELRHLPDAGSIK